ncbi:MAG: hypothetical protein CL927_02680 [Deltaproteobacteria bacterium]|nr:hypothetical protein [Deltaproteobacteria bacterium]HCH64025.1 hypothetical protein [Deltaproteobacteria bacterium]
MFLLVGCAKPPPPTPPDPSLAHVGVWFGTGMAFPEGQLCLVFCPNKRFFAADTTCDDTAHADFQRTWTWSRTSDGLLTAIREDDRQLAMRFRQQAPAEGLFDLVGYPSLPMTRIDLLSPACLP